MNTIYDYTDYRSYLADIMAERKKANAHFSFRHISQFLGLKSSGFFNLVLHGKRHLSESLSHRVAELFRLSEREREYFLYLVQYNSAKKQMEKKYYFERMVECRSRHVKKIEPAQYLLYSKWHYHIIREMLPLMTFKGDFVGLAKKLRPSITTGEARGKTENHARPICLDRGRVYAIP
jgi:uncharacterized protein (TIGR02147 family)